MEIRDSLAGRLRAIVGPDHALTDPALTASYEVDWTRRYRGPARLVVRPGSADEVAATVRACAAEGAAIVPQGGNTGLVGGGVPRAGEVVVSLRRLDAMAPVDLVTRQLTVGAGATLGAVRRHARAAGLDVAVDLASREEATVGGMVATNAGGTRVLRYGTMRAQVAGLEAVLAGGGIVRRLSEVTKDSCGYDLVGLLVGSEGTLGVVTRVRLRLVPLLTRRAVALLAVAGTAEALEALAHLRASLQDLECAEILYRDGLDLVRSLRGARPPFRQPYPAFLLVECAGVEDPTEPLAEALAATPGLLDAVMAGDSRGRAALWDYREAHAEAIGAAGVPLKLDVGVPPAALPDLVEALHQVVPALAPAARLIVFGHLAEGNLHVNVLGVADEPALAEAVTEAVLRLVVERSGTISAEHGVGVAKAPWLKLARSPAELEAMRAIKTALDPAGLLNPGVLLPLARS